MWIQSYSKTYQDVKKENIWQLWRDVNNWHKWDSDIKYCKLTEPFAVGNYFILKPKGGPSVKIQLVEIIENKTFTDCTKFFGAKMYSKHEMEETAEGLKLSTTTRVIGPLKFIWIKLVAQGIVNTTPTQMDTLVNLAKANNR